MLLGWSEKGPSIAIQDEHHRVQKIPAAKLVMSQMNPHLDTPSSRRTFFFTSRFGTHCAFLNNVLFHGSRPKFFIITYLSHVPSSAVNRLARLELLLATLLKIHFFWYARQCRWFRTPAFRSSAVPSSSVSSCVPLLYHTSNT
jgi:hypothetical protein